MISILTKIIRIMLLFLFFHNQAALCIGISLFLDLLFFSAWFTDSSINVCFLKLRLVTFVIIIVSFSWCKLREQKQYRLQISAQENQYRRRLMKKKSVSALKNPYGSIPSHKWACPPRCMMGGWASPSVRSTGSPGSWPIYLCLGQSNMSLSVNHLSGL